jgi:methyl-accepting chemotaxis protein
MKNFNIRQKMLVYIVSSGLLVLTVSSVFNYFQQRKTIDETLENNAHLALRNNILKIQFELNKYKILTESMFRQNPPRQLAITQTNPSISSTRNNKYLEPTLNNVFAPTKTAYPEIKDIYMGLANTGRYISLDYIVYSDPEYDVRKRSWFNETAEFGEIMFGSLIYSYDDSSVTLTTQVPLYQNDALIAVGGVDINISHIRDFVSTFTFGKTGQSFLVMEDRNILHFPDLEFNLERRLNQLDSELENTSGFATLDSLLWHSDSGDYTLTYQGERYKVFFSRLPDFNWRAGLLIAESELLEPSEQVFRSAIYYLVFAGVFLLMITFFIATPIVKPIKDLAERFFALSSLEGDLTQTIQSKRNDEIGAAARGFNIFIEQIRNLVKSIKDRAYVIGGSIGQLVVGANDMEKGAREISNQSSEIAAAITQLSQSIIHITDNTNQIKKSISSSKDAVEDSHAQIEQFIEGAERMVTGFNFVGGLMSELSSYTEAINKTIGFIDDIADRVSLLALNASIEAASAGEHGKGFTVVANEIKRFSTQIFKQTKDTKKRLEKFVVTIQESEKQLQMLNTVAQNEFQYSQQAREAMETMNKAIGKANTSIIEISTEASQQAQSTELIANSVNDIADRNKAFLETISDSVHSIDGINEKIQELQSLVRKLKVD